MKNYTYQNNLIGKKQLRQLLAWSFTNYDSMQSSSLADQLKYLGFKYATQAGISISIEDLKIPFVKSLMLEKATKEIQNAEKIYLNGKITDVERCQKIIDTWSLTSESLKNEIIYYFKNYDPLNSVYIMAFSGARGNLSQVRQLVGMRGLMSDPSGQIMNLPIKKNFREGLTITDYLMSGYGARKGIVDTALKTANSGYLTRRLIDVAQDILIREKDCLTNHAFLVSVFNKRQIYSTNIYEKIRGRVLKKPILELDSNSKFPTRLIQITPELIEKSKEKNIKKFYVRSPLTCNLYRAICQKCYGWDLANENLVDIGEAIGILSGQSIGEPGTQLTMRTFHTGGIFTSEARQQVINPLNGVIQFSKNLKTVMLRTNRGEEVLVTRNSGMLVIIPDDKKQNLIQIEIFRNTILFPKHNQYILKDTVIGELINTNKQIKTEVKAVLSDTCGEIFIPRLKQQINLLNNNKLIWILSGQLYNSPKNSFLNFYPDYKLNQHSYIFRTKLISHYNGSVDFINKKKSLFQRLVEITNNRYSLSNSNFKKLSSPINLNNYILILDKFKYFVKMKRKKYKYYLQVTRNEKLSTLLLSAFRTLTGGTIYYNLSNIGKRKKVNEIMSYYRKISNLTQYRSIGKFRTVVWLGEEIHQVTCEFNMLLVEEGDFIAKGFEIIPGLFSKTCGIVSIFQENHIVKLILIKSGLVYEGKRFKNQAKKLYYPGEVVFSNMVINNIVFCEYPFEKNPDQLLVRPIQIYEFPKSIVQPKSFQSSFVSRFNVKSAAIYSYKSNQSIKGNKSLTLICNLLTFKTNRLLTNNINLELTNNKKRFSLELKIIEKLILPNYINPNLRYQPIQSCFLIQKHQFVSNYMILGYLESITLNSLEIVKYKIRKKNTRQIFLISNKDCLIISKNKIKEKKLNNFIMFKSAVSKTGKIIIENDDFVTIQKGRPYFFPNCKNENLISKTKLQYKFIASDRIKLEFRTTKNVLLNYHNIIRLWIKRSIDSTQNLKSKISIKSDFSKFFIKNRGKLYSCLLPQFFKKFTITNKFSQQKINKLCCTKKLSDSRKINRTLLIKSSELSINKNRLKSKNQKNYQLSLLKFVEQPFIKSTKSVGLYSITEDYFEQDTNRLFCQNTEFIEMGKTIGLLNLEKEITGDIVQGLPRIEEILEARKKNILIKQIATSQKKGLLFQKTSLDPNFEFKKLGFPVQENDKINPHKLLKVYFNYYGLLKYFLSNKTSQFQYNRLIKNYEGTYKSFKKVQLFILNSVQAVYNSQGVTINDKHLEVIIKQMTTRILITYEGNTPLLRREVIDLYHVRYINKIMKEENKQEAYYIPLLLGITKAALNNPSFISAASFQETTRVLTIAAIEGRIDWLRGLKENIIIGHLIPAGTGSQNYRTCFKKSFKNTILTRVTIHNMSQVA